MTIHTIHITKHGPDCTCEFCAAKLQTARAILKRNPLVNRSQIKPEVWRFIYFARTGKVLVEKPVKVSPWAQEGPGIEMVVRGDSTQEDSR